MTQAISADPDGAGVTLDPLVVSYAHDDAGRVETITDSRGAVTTLVYDKLDRVVEEWVHDGDSAASDGYLSVTSFTFDPNGNVALVTLYDVTNVSRASLDTTNLATWAAANPTKLREHGYEFDEVDRLEKEIHPDATFVSYAFDDAGRLVTFTDELERATTYGYNDAGWLDSVTEPDPDGVGGVAPSVTSYAFDAVGNVMAMTDALGNRTDYRFDSLDRLVEEINPDPDDLTVDGPNTRPTTSYAYNPAGEMVSLTDPVGNTTHWTLDALGRVVREMDATRQSRHFEFDPVGNLVTYVDKRGLQTDYEFDALNRVTTETWVGDDNEIQYVYANTGDLESVRDDFSKYVYTHDALGRVLTVDTEGYADTPDVVMEYEFDALGQLSSVIGTGDGSLSNVYVHDDNGRVDIIAQAGYNTTKWIDIDRYADGRMETIERYEGSIATTNLVARSEFVFDGMGRLDTLSHEDQYSAVIADYDFDYDKLSRIIDIASVDGFAMYLYDNTSQLIGVEYATGHPLANDDESYRFDENGNRVAPDIETGRSNRLLENADTSYAYDEEGSLTEAIIKADGTYVELSWDHRGRMIAMAVYSDSEQTQLLSNFEYTYDVFNRRIAKELDMDGDTVVDTTERMIYDGAHIAMVFDEYDTLRHRYLHGPAIDMVLSDEAFDASGAFDEIYWALADHQGTIRDVVSFNAANDTTFLEQHLIIDTFGNIKEEAVPIIRFVYTGREYDPESGLYYYRARYYDSVSGRFISQDPIGFTGGDGNLYRYVSNSVTNFTDPFGLDDGPAGDGSWSGTAWAYTKAIGSGLSVGFVEIGRAASYPLRWCGADFSASDEYWDEYERSVLLFPVDDSAIMEGTRTAAAVGVAAAGGAIGLELAAAAGITEIGTVPITTIPSTAKVELYFFGATGTTLPAFLRLQCLTAAEAAEIQAIANKYKTTIDVVGSRASGGGRNIGTNLPIGRDPGMRSDIDFRIDPSHPQADQLIEELGSVGNGAGSAGRQWGPEPTYPPFIRFIPQ